MKTAQGGKIFVEENGKFCYTRPNHGKSFNEEIECTTKCKGKHEKSSFNIHTGDIDPNENALMDASEIHGKPLLAMDLGLNLDFSGIQNKGANPLHGILNMEHNSCASSPKHCASHVSTCNTPCPPPAMEHNLHTQQAQEPQG